ncbi:Na+/H+ antiporter NhaC family protein [Mediterraneibacter faecis]|uniref:Na+/H+ antiporter NhaC family protein n=1 Tax=Mediterraneibacter faecis TaxID=592978 RepID=UPI001D06E2C5|nr:Na+/H+ antiporter NhaC family protein [Mediterraneibacter faecis]MCB5921234.1 Na+/H+ antiporter NhaC family protein [Lachnospiraceae bacterium 210521-DFI.1.105]MCB6299301.1 Na+/H+ antiporter NhaC family protein [Mediterraneibacter faecis]MCB6445958.1 Na+/H+ antiporter NhaC family protein [Mediterraneibacter faecis]MCQ5257917.1 Na+/H+ antiporter NhaC family protein [Mediterraneibacter faecis]MCQ5260884.1 Na+/H+ antiporter NhaC family protein [Mediterraneibacter faecis]
MEKEKKGRAIALLPIGVFLIIFLGAGIVFKDFYAMPAIVAFLIALFVAFLQNKELSFNKKIEVIAKGVGEENIITMSLIFLCAGGFSGAVTAVGGVDSTVNLGLSLIPAHFAVAGLFLIGCFISVSMGTSMGTIAALAPIAVGISEKTGFALSICIGAVVCGAMFGDNLSMISDTTIAAVKTQGCEMKDKFKANFFIVLPAAIITVLIFWFVTRNMNFHLEENLSYSLWEVLPYMVVLLGALIGINVFVVLISGIVISLIVGVSMGHIALSEMFQVVGNGVTSMYDITVISIIVACIVSLVKEHGGIQFILNLIKSKINGRRGAEFGIALLALFVDACTANNTVAIVMTGPIAKEISEEFDVDPRRSASLLDMFTSVGQGIIPYGAQLLSAATLTGLTPLQIIPNLYYPLLMGVCGVLTIIFRPQSKKLQ